jgi:hypothetical protein
MTGILRIYFGINMLENKNNLGFITLSLTFAWIQNAE